MVFPSLVFNIEPGVVSQFSGFAVIAFAYFIHRMRRIALIALLLVSGFFATKVHALMAVGNPYYNTYQQPNLNYYGVPWGYRPPVYFYPNLQFHSLYDPFAPYYFQPHYPSPYAPYPTCPWAPTNNTPTPYFPNNNMPMS